MRRFYFAFLPCLFCLLPVEAAIIYVNPLAGGANTGIDWINAYTDLQLALSAATSGDEVWVAQGVYVPSVEVDLDGSGGTDAREVSFQIPDGVQLYGGFVGGEMTLSERDWITNKTILSGDIGGDDVNLDANQIAETTADLQGANAYHVLTTQSVSAMTLVDGFVITAGQADGVGFTPHSNGGGWFNDDNPPADLSSPGIRNCQFSGNYASRSGGGLYIGSFTAGTYAPHLENCAFSGNEAYRSGGAIYLLGDMAVLDTCTFTNNAVTAFDPMMNTLPGSGGAVMMVASNAQFTRCDFTANSATGNATGAFEGGGGGAVYINQSSSPTDAIGASHPHFYNCGFYQNTTGGNGSAWGGAAVHFSDGGNLSITYEGCVFWGNSATDDGGAIANFARTLGPPTVLDPILEPHFINCTFADNQAGNRGGALFFDGYVFNMVEMLNSATVNSILYGNSAGISDPEVFNTGNNTFSYSLIAGSNGSLAWNASIGLDGGNNIDDDPLFADLVGGDLTVMAGSSAIDAGNDAAVSLGEDIVGGTRIQGASVDMGAFESALSGPLCDLPPGLLHMDIGKTGGYVGEVCYDMGTYTVDASGNDIWWHKDGFHFVYQAMTGNGEIIARVDDLGYNHFWDLAGVMMRSHLNAASPNVLVAVNAGGLAFMQRRLFPHHPTGIRFGGNGTTPKWLKIVRYGNHFAGYKSNDGLVWKWIGTTYVHMPNTIYVGIATSTPLEGTPNLYTLSQLSINGMSYKRPPFDPTELSVMQDIDGPRPVQKIASPLGMTLSPNPTTQQIQIDFASELTQTIRIEILDLQGRSVSPVIQQEVLAYEPLILKLPVNDLARGTYLLRISGTSQQWIEKVVLTE